MEVYKWRYHGIVLNVTTAEIDIWGTFILVLNMKGLCSIVCYDFVIFSVYIVTYHC